MLTFWSKTRIPRQRPLGGAPGVPCHLCRLLHRFVVPSIRHTLAIFGGFRGGLGGSTYPLPQSHRRDRHLDPHGPVFLSHHGVLGSNGARADRRAHPSGLGRRAPAGTPRRAKAAHDAQQGAISPTTAPERCASPRSRPEPGGVDSDAVPLDTRFKPLMIKN